MREDLAPVAGSPVAYSATRGLPVMLLRTVCIHCRACPCVVLHSSH